MQIGFVNIWLVLFFPVIGFILQALFGPMILKRLGPKGRPLMGFFAVLPIAAAFVIAAQLTMQLAGLDPSHRTVILTLFDWIHIQTLWVPFEFRVDTLSMTMVLIITGVGALIHLYATAYMADEEDYSRFFTYLNLFIAAMLTLVLGNNLVLLFIGWEGVGACSYLLIGFWYKDLANSKAANKAFIVNRIGDYGLTLGMFLIVWLLTTHMAESGIHDARWLSYDNILPALAKLAPDNGPVITMIAGLLFVGAMGKSAQFPLYIWLPDAMAGPTPVSALIHAATMVTSGVVLLNRMHVVFDASPNASAFVAIIGAITALLGALIAFGQTDIKKVLAFSTVSQLGYMFIACGSGAMWAGMFHVTTHAFFKALLFLGAGAVIHAMSHNQDMRNYGGLYKYIKVTCVTMVIGWLAISGIWPFAGFWSKDEILSAAINDPKVVTWGSLDIHPGPIAGVVGFVVAILTAWYMTRMTLLTFASGPERWKQIEPAHDNAHAHHHEHAHGHDHGHAHEDPHGFFMTDEELAANTPPAEHHHDLDKDHVPHEVPWPMLVTLVILAGLSIVGGFGLVKSLDFQHWLYPGAEEAPQAISALTLQLVGTACALIGIGLGIFQYWRGLPADEGWDLAKWNPLRIAASRQFSIDWILSAGSIELGGIIGSICAKFDKGVIDGIVNGVGSLCSGVGGLVGRLQTGYVRTYALFLQIGAVILISYFIYVVVSLGGKL